jgi:ribulose bisphosphate carboxylase small subunit
VVPTPGEAAFREGSRAEQERLRAEQEQAKAEQERLRADRLATYLRSIGVDPDSL